METILQAVVEYLPVPWLIASLGLLLLALLACVRPRLSGTTLVAPWYWSLVAVATIAGCELAIVTLADSAASWVPPTRYIAGVAVFCPVIALLGAKRPQDRAWQLIVLSFWAILALPALTALLFSHANFELNVIWSCFLVVLLAVSILNHLPTCYWPASLLAGGAQACLLLDFLTFTHGFTAAILRGHPEWSSVVTIVALALLLAATVVAHSIARSQRQASRHSSRQPLDRMWLDFRNSFGAMWGLRVAERINSAADISNTSVTLRWDGFHAIDEDEQDVSEALIATLPTKTQESVKKMATNLLRRFVSPQWIDHRYPESGD